MVSHGFPWFPMALGQVEILPLLLSVLKALQNGSCQARKKAAERCLSELEALMEGGDPTMKPP